MNHVVYLLGAGTSIKAGLPDVGSLTERIMSDDAVSRSSDALYRLAPPIEEEPRSRFDVYLNRVLLRTLMGIHLETRNLEVGSNPTYEDLYFLLDQLESHLEGRVVNPLIADRVRSLVSAIPPSEPKPKHDGDTELLHRANEAMRMIEAFVFTTLVAKPQPLDYLDALLAPVSNESPQGATIFTLNHDLVLENYFASKKCSLFTGFCDGAPAKGRFDSTVPVWRWSPWEEFAPAHQGFSLFKLHGSVDWFFNGEEWFRFAEEPDYSDWHSQRLQAANLALGTHNKYNFYSWSIFSDLQTLFRRSLKASLRVIVAGFSFNDRLVSNMLEAWMRYDSSRRLLLINPRAEEIMKSRSTPFHDQWQEWCAQGRVTVEKAKVEDLDPQRVRDFIE